MKEQAEAMKSSPRMLPDDTEPLGLPRSEHQHSFAEGSHNGVCIATRSGIAFINQPLLDLLGYESLEQLKGQRLKRLLRKHLPDGAAALLHDASRVLQGQSHHRDLKILISHVDQTERHLHLCLESVVRWRFSGHSGLILGLPTPGKPGGDSCAPLSAQAARPVHRMTHGCLS